MKMADVLRSLPSTTDVQKQGERRIVDLHRVQTWERVICNGLKLCVDLDEETLDSCSLLAVSSDEKMLRAKISRRSSKGRAFTKQRAGSMEGGTKLEQDEKRTVNHGLLSNAGWRTHCDREGLDGLKRERHRHKWPRRNYFERM